MTQLKRPLWLALTLTVVLALGACGAQATPEPQETGAISAELTAQPTGQPAATSAPLPTTAQTVEPTTAPTVEPTAAAANEPTAEPTSASGPALDPNALAQPADLDSFRSDIEISWQGTVTGSVESSGSFSMSVEYIDEPRAQHIVISGDAPVMSQLGLQPGDRAELYLMNGTLYLNLGGSWLSAPAGDDIPGLSDLGTVVAKDVLADVEGARFVGTETINGIETNHYSFDETALADAELGPDSEIEDAQGDVYVAIDGNYIVRLDVTMSGTNLDVPTGAAEAERLSSGSFRLTMDLSDVNEAFDIELPPEAQESGG